MYRFIVAGAATFTLAAATPALAHTEVQSTYPGNGKTAARSIQWVSVTFKSTVRGGTLKVTGPGGTVSAGAGGRDPQNVKRLRVKLRGGLRAGSYKASWTVRHTDGHTLRGSFSFKLK